MDNQGGNWTSDRRLYLDANGAVVEHDDNTKVELLVGEGGTIPMQRAKELGLVGAESKAKAAAPDNKAVDNAPATKAKGKG